MGFELIYLFFLVPAFALMALLLFCIQHVVRASWHESWRENTKRCLVLFGFSWFCVAFTSISLSLTLDSMLDGSAVNGEQRGNVFYVGNHGRFSEVSETQYQWSMRLHNVAELALFPVRIVTSIPMCVPLLIGFVWYAYDRLSECNTDSQKQPEPSDAPKDRASGKDVPSVRSLDGGSPLTLFVFIRANWRSLDARDESTTDPL